MATYTTTIYVSNEEKEIATNVTTEDASPEITITIGEYEGRLYFDYSYQDETLGRYVAPENVAAFEYGTEVYLPGQSITGGGVAGQNSEIAVYCCYLIATPGTYRCQTTPSGEGLIFIPMLFSSGGTTFTDIGFGAEGVSEGVPCQIYYINSETSENIVYSGDTGWADESYRTVSVEETQYMTNEAWATWFAANYTIVDDDDTDTDYDGVIDDGAEFEETYSVTGDALVATANAIRAKTGGTSRIEWKTDGFAEAVQGISGGITEISTADEMDALLTAENVGNIYRYTGETDDTYTNGDLYEVVA